MTAHRIVLVAVSSLIAARIAMPGATASAEPDPGELAKAAATLAQATTPEQVTRATVHLAELEEAMGAPWAAALDLDRAAAWSKDRDLGERGLALRARLRRAPTRLGGPYASVAAMCPDLAAMEDRVGVDSHDDPGENPAPPGCGRCEFVCEAPTELLHLDHSHHDLPAGTDEVVVLASRSLDRAPPYIRNHSAEEYYDEAFINVAVRAGDDWYLAPAVNGAESWRVAGVSVLESRVQATGEHARRALVLRVAYDRERSERFSWHYQDVVVIGVGRSGVPSITAPIRVAASERDSPYGDPPQCETETDATRAWSIGGGALRVTRVTTTSTACERSKRRTSALSERYSLAFP